MKSVQKEAARYVIATVLLIVFSIFLAKDAYASVPFNQAYVTLTNSRFSFKGSLSSAITAGTAVGTISGSGFSDNNTANLFNGDLICLNGNTGNGCIDNRTFTVNNVLSSTSVAFTPTITGSAMAGDSIVSTQSGVMVFTFRPTTNVASGSKIVVLVPSAATNYNDGIPDSTGFDAAALPSGANGLQTGVCATGACFGATSFTTSAVTLTPGATNHSVVITLSSALNNTTNYSFTLGATSSATLRFLNPSPTGTTHVRGVADTYSVTLSTKDSTETTTYDQTLMKAAPIDGVLVTANVEESISYTINDASNGYGGNIAASTNVTQCNGGTFSTSVATTATAVPFGSILNLDTFYRAAQSHYVVTNTANGYLVTVQEDGPLTGTSGNIPDGTCDGACNSTTQAAWATSTNNGFGYTLGNITGTDAVFTGTNFRTFGTSPVTFMTKASQTSGSRVATCYLLSVDIAQPAGFYYNKLTYIATPKF